MTKSDLTQSTSENVTPAEVAEVSQVIPDSKFSRNDVIVTVEAKWWGYYVGLNQAAVELLDLILDILEYELEKIIVSPTLRTAIAAAIKLKQTRLKTVTARTGNNGCRLVSP